MDMPATKPSGHDMSSHDQMQPASSNGVSPITDQSSSAMQATAAAATAVEPETTTVIDSIPWGTSGTATAKGHSASAQTGGGRGGSIKGGTTGGSGGGRFRPSGGGGEEDSGDSGSSSWQQWLVKLLLASGGVTAVSLMSSTVREALRSAVFAFKSQFAAGKPPTHGSVSVVFKVCVELFAKLHSCEVI